MPNFFVLDVRDPPEKVIAAMLDFSHRRPEIWPNLSAKIYQAHSVGEYTADVTEGTVQTSCCRSTGTSTERREGAGLNAALCTGKPKRRSSRHLLTSKA